MKQTKKFVNKETQQKNFEGPTTRFFGTNSNKTIKNQYNLT